MGFISFMGRAMFASLFILTAWQAFNEFGVDGGPAAKEVAPKLVVVQNYLTSLFGKRGPNIDAWHFVVVSIVLKGIGGLLFLFGSPIGAYLLLSYLASTSPLLYNFYNYNSGQPEFLGLYNEFLQCLALFGALLFFIGMKNTIQTIQLKKKTPKSKTS